MLLCFIYFDGAEIKDNTTLLLLLAKEKLFAFFSVLGPTGKVQTQWFVNTATHDNIIF